MIRFIWKNWWRNKERFILLLIGALIVSAGLSYLVGLSETNKGTIVDTLEQRWSASYDIVVRPPDSRSVTEEKGLLEPNYLSGLSGGISIEQYEQIKAMEGVDVAAPIAMIGYVYKDIVMEELHIKEPGVYRLTISEKTDTGVHQIESSGPSLYFTVGWQAPGMGKEYGVIRFEPQVLNMGNDVLIAGIDPEAEAKLVGLDNAVIPSSTSRFFENMDTVSSNQSDLGWKTTNLPVLLSNQDFVDSEMIYKIEKLDLPFGSEVATETMEKVKENGAEKYLDTIEAVNQEVYTYSSQEAHQKLIESIKENYVNSNDILLNKPTPVNYQPVTSPYVERWPYAYTIDSYEVPDSSNLAVHETYRPVEMTSEDFSTSPRLNINFIGLFDSSKLNISKDPLNELPMETYFPSKAQQVLDVNNQPVNPPKEMKPISLPYGFLTKPPSMLTTIEAAASIVGDRPISAIRIKAKDVADLSEESQQKLEDLAAHIEKETGLITDITLGSSPQPAIAYVPEIEGRESSGWLQQPWIKLGSSFAIFKETKVGFSGVVGSVVLVAIVYVFASNLISMYARNKEFAVLLSIGWRPKQLAKLIYTEALLLGLFVSFVSWAILGFILLTHETDTSVKRILLIGILGLIIYVLGAVIPALLTRKIKPYDAMRTGEITKGKRFFRTKSIFTMSFNQLLSKWRRSILSIVAIAVPTSLLTVFLFVTFQLQGVMFTTWLGQFVALEVGPMHYVAMGVALLIAILTTAEIIWQNITERRPEIAVLKAVGWKNRSVRWMVLLEGVLSGILAGIVGLLIAFIIIWRMYQTFPQEHLGFLVLTGIVPIITGFIGAIVPAQKAVNIQPYQGMQGTLSNNRITEKRFKIVIGTLAVVLFASFIALMAQAVPEVKDNPTADKNVENVPAPTVGDVVDKDVVENNQKEKADEVVGEVADETKYRGGVYKQGENVADSEHTELYFGQLMDTPAEHKVEQLDGDKAYLTIPITFINNSERQEAFGPNLYKLYSSDGTEYKPVSSSIIDNNGWKSGVITGEGSVKWAVTYVIPKDVKEWSIVFQRPSWVDERLVKVNIEK
ncbi:FtsX-like permease family protein [Salirhabdus sp. Marseille-P4669]|uniref:FtsX-like permease family protein n=1 Tax=Salirhabdus sp. Marseille-P4669 TaxID=2042310 RepID=UPI000C7B8C8C|nr:FtsX-like permease family protein [Salirhabdus sp. Marseille-P4669]